MDTTVELANKVGAAEIISRIVDDLKDEAEQYRKMVMETIEKIMGNLGAADIDHKLEEQLIDGILYAFQEQTTEVGKRLREFSSASGGSVTLTGPNSFSSSQDSVMLNGFGTVVNALGKRVKPYLPQICGTVLWRLNNKSAKVRQQAADLISRTAVVMKTCQEVRSRCRDAASPSRWSCEANHRCPPPAGEADGSLGRRAVRVPGRGVSRSPGQHPGSPQGHRQCDR